MAIKSRHYNLSLRRHDQLVFWQPAYAEWHVVFNLGLYLSQTSLTLSVTSALPLQVGSAYPVNAMYFVGLVTGGIQVQAIIDPAALFTVSFASGCFICHVQHSAK